MNLKEIKEVINLMNENDLSEIEIEREGTKIKIKKTSAEFPPAFSRPSVNYHVDTQVQPKPVEAAASLANANHKLITSPMVGTFYHCPSPDAPPFVEVGQTVEVGQVVCIVEAMKLMNEIKSEIRGKVVEAPVENAQPVEFGQTLFVLEPI